MKKILVIDDADFILESTSTLLRFEGYEVFTAGDGISGVDAAIQYRPDLVLCDISMPGLDGYGVLEKIRTSPETSTIPFIFLTAFTEKANMRAGMERGADDFLVKPYSRDELIAAINAQWNKHQLIEKQVREKVEQVGRNVTYALPHEFRTVLNQVVGSAKYLKSNASEIESDETVEIADDIISSSERLLKITENFLIYVQIESLASNEERRKQLRNFYTDEPGAVLSDVAEHIAQKYNRIDDLIIDESVENLTIEISTQNFNKISHELLDNAFRFSRKGTPVRLRMWVANGFIFASLSDYGRGMSQEQIAQVGAYIQFERTIYEQQGVGLGLVIAKRLVELHDGSFGLLSEEGKGTSVTFSLPCTSDID
jgi:two-component system, sensor histidine kinase and response regulator